MIDSKIAKRLKLAREQADFDNVVEMTKDFGWNINTYRSHENGIRGIPSNKLAIYARAFNVSIDWLMTGKGTKPGIGRTVPSRRVSVIGVVQGGAFMETEPVFIDDQVSLPVAYDPRYQDAEQYLLEVRGPSMNKIYPDGSYAHCVHIEYHPDDIMPENGDHVIVERRQGSLREVTIKEYVITNKGAELWPRSHDRAWQTPIKLTDDMPIDEVQITALVVGCYFATKT